MQIVEQYKASIDESTAGKISVVATTFGPRVNENGIKLWYTKEAFKPIAESITKDTPLPMYIEHNDSMLPVGEWNSADATESGLELSGQLFMETTSGKDAYTILKNSNLFGNVSISTHLTEYKMVDKNGMETKDKDAYAFSTKVDVSEVSLVINPANPNAVITNVESMINTSIKVRKLERDLRDAGLSCADAKTAISIIKSQSHRDGPDEKLCVGNEMDSTAKESLVDDSEADLIKLNEELKLYILSEQIKNEFSRRDSQRSKDD